MLHRGQPCVSEGVDRLLGMQNNCRTPPSIAPQAHALLADRVTSAVRVSRLSKLMASLNAVAAQHVQQQQQQQQQQAVHSTAVPMS